LNARVLRTIAEVDRAAWDALDHGASPFLRHGFLTALEASGSVGGPRGGWAPRYVLVEQGARLVGALAAFVKHDSYGEYIFDWSWASASERAGIPYYPKLVVAAPATPATGVRLLVAPAADRAAVIARLVAELRALADAERCSSIHWLFCTEEERDVLAALGFAPRRSMQFHWHNRGYPDFDGFLAELASRKRKQVRKERAAARAAVDAIELVPGAELSGDDLAAIERFYRTTVAEHGGQAYLGRGFFGALQRELPGAMLFARARKDGRTIAGALFLETEQALYGRYWGADQPIEMLHFELAYYVGIERAIARGLPLFEAGAQGGHKLVRGFAPRATHSCHWLRHPGLDAAVRGFLVEEARAVDQHMLELAERLPYRKVGDGDPG
jgi:predicted N-acyltransferase